MREYPLLSRGVSMEWHLILFLGILIGMAISGCGVLFRKLLTAESVRFNIKFKSSPEELDSKRDHKQLGD